MTIAVEKKGSRMWLTFPYDPTLVAKAKRVPGGAFSKEGGPHWTYGLSVRTCKLLREQFGAEMVVGPELSAWARAAIKREAELVQLGSQSDATLFRMPDHAPVLAKAMESRTYQRVASRFIADGKRVLIADQPGLGKTLESLGGIVESGLTGPVLILSLRTAMRSVWLPEITRWMLKGTNVRVVDGTNAKRTASIDEFWKDVEAQQDSLHFLICNPEMIRTRRKADGKVAWYEHKYPGLFSAPWSAVIIDESAHNQSSLVAQSAAENKMSQFRLGARHLPVAEYGLRIALSGTPMRGKPRNMWGTLNWLEPSVYTSFWKWVETYFHVWESWDGGVKHMEIGDMKEPERFADDLRAIMLRRTKGEVASDLPPKQYGGTPLDPSDPSSPVGVWVPLLPEQEKAYRSMVTNAAVELNGGSLMANGVLAELTRLKQFAGSHGEMVGTHFTPTMPSNKFDVVVAMLEERGITGDPDKDEGDSGIVIASQFTQLINLFATGLRGMGIQVSVLTGETPDSERKRVIDDFQAGNGPRVFMLNTKAGGVAVTLDRADDMIILDETWVPDDQEQVEDRIHRVSRVHPVTIYYIRSLGTLEEGIARNNVQADDVQKWLMDATRGVDVTRLLLGGR
jgi:SNF2 family DNA or RNA helicase